MCSCYGGARGQIQRIEKQHNIGPFRQKPHLFFILNTNSNNYNSSRTLKSFSNVVLLSPTQAGPDNTRFPVLTPSSEPKITSSQIIKTTGRDNTEENRRGRALRRTHVTPCVTRAEMLTRTRRQTHTHTHAYMRECVPGVHSPSCQRPPTLQQRPLPNDLAGLRAADPTGRPPG